MIRQTARLLQDRIALRRLRRNVELDIALRSKVRYSRISSELSRLHIGDRTIFEGSIAADRAGAQVSIGDRTFIGESGLIAAERITIGDDVLISWGCTIVDHHSHALRWADRRDDVVEYYDGRKDWSKVRIAPVTIENKVWIGFDAVILAGVTIGEGAVVGCRSVVTRDVEPYTVVAGTPARTISILGNEDGDGK